MPADLQSADEHARLAAVRRYHILDTPPEAPFERITALAARIFDVPISIVSIVDAARIWFKAHRGIDIEAVDRDDGMCASAILGDGPWVINDAKADPRSAEHPLVAREGGIRFYAGAPLRTPDGHNLGMLCVLDYTPRSVAAEELSALEDLASLVMDELELRLLSRRSNKAGDIEVSWEAPPPPKVRTLGAWGPMLEAVAGRPGEWAKLAHYDGETSAYRIASRLRQREDLPPGRWEFAARRAASGSDLFARFMQERTRNG